MRKRRIPHHRRHGAGLRSPDLVGEARVGGRHESTDCSALVAMTALSLVASRPEWRVVVGFAGRGGGVDSRQGAERTASLPRATNWAFLMVHARLGRGRGTDAAVGAAVVTRRGITSRSSPSTRCWRRSRTRWRRDRTRNPAGRSAGPAARCRSAASTTRTPSCRRRRPHRVAVPRRAGRSPACAGSTPRTSTRRSLHGDPLGRSRNSDSARGCVGRTRRRRRAITARRCQTCR